MMLSAVAGGGSASLRLASRLAFDTSHLLVVVLHCLGEVLRPAVLPSGNGVQLQVLPPNVPPVE